ncbi:hypothetical protein R5W23_003156 [Gemmata sp. JC673]|uniref:Uncharacterized protein n=1 Tax=Gemmata algarum TaxID=2975278 RepID=A0ABU5F2K1_9BACT|nr:hypothetical protein [Gemmata algarum]MDY3561729.1 hypothetical protein [Gemmata algarum]
MPEQPTIMFVLRGRVGTRELLRAACDAATALLADPTCRPAFHCAEVTSFTGESLLLLSGLCHPFRSAGVIFRLIEVPAAVLVALEEQFDEATVALDVRHRAEATMCAKGQVFCRACVNFRKQFDYRSSTTGPPSEMFGHGAVAAAG